MRADAISNVERWNADIAARQSGAGVFFNYKRLEPQFTPTIGAALLAKKPFLRLYCPGCQQHGDVDLRRIVRPADFPITGIYDALTCVTGCRGDGPRPVSAGRSTSAN